MMLECLLHKVIVGRYQQWEEMPVARLVLFDSVVYSLESSVMVELDSSLTL